MRTRLFSASVTFVALAGASFGASPAAGSQGLLSFQATVSGKGHDAGSFSRAESATDWIKFIGCAIVKERAVSILGNYTYRVRTGGVYQAGVKPMGPGVYLVVDHFRPGASINTYGRLDVSGSFAINGHAYGNAVASFKEPATVKIWDGGRSGTWTVRYAHRNYPARILYPVEGFAFRVSWHCTSVFHLSAT